jgi:hypothetical protein
LLERDMIAARVADELRLVVIASRAYLEGHGRPKTPHDLLSVNQLPALPPPNRPNPLIRNQFVEIGGSPWSCRSAACRARARYTTAIAVFSLRSPGSATNYPLGNRRHACHEPSLLELSGVNTFAEIDDHVLAV